MSKITTKPVSLSGQVVTGLNEGLYNIQFSLLSIVPVRKNK
jgi:hypothetical protein